MYPWMLVCGLSHIPRICACIGENNNNIYPIYVDGDQVLAFVAQHLVDQQWDPAAADDAAIINGSQSEV